MQFILTIFLTAALGFSMLQCQKTAIGKSETAAATANVQSNTQNNSLNASSSATATPEEAPRISLADAKKDFDARTAIFIDTRGEASYKTEHIKGAINIPADAFETRYTEVPKNKKVIAYCS